MLIILTESLKLASRQIYPIEDFVVLNYAVPPLERGDLEI